MLLRACLALTLLLAFPLTSVAQQPPVLFVHGFCSNSNTWDTLFDLLPNRRFGDSLLRYYQAADGSVQRSAGVGTNPGVIRSYAIDFYNRQERTFEPGRVAEVSIAEKVGQLKAVIDRIKTDSRSRQVILVGHSMGGLVSRAYAQGYGLDASNRSISFGHDVAGVITIDTPHQGTLAARIPLDTSNRWMDCFRRASVNKAELSDTSPLLRAINSRPWESGVALDAIYSYSVSHPEYWFGDGLVSTDSQDVRNISNYWRQHPDVRGHGHSIWRDFNGLLHNAVLGFTTTASLVLGLVEDIDDRPAPVCQVTTSIALGQSLSANWTGDCASAHREGSLARYFTLSIARPTTVQIDLESSHDAYLYLLRGVSPSSAVLTSDDDGGSGTNARITWLLQPGSYTIEATTYSVGVSGTFTLRVASALTDPSTVTTPASPNTTPSPSPAPAGPLSPSITVITGPATSIGTTTATITATASSNVPGSLVFDYGATSNYGASIAAGSFGSTEATSSFQTTIRGLTCGSTYRYRARATYNGSTVSVGAGRSFLTTPCSSPTSPPRSAPTPSPTPAPVLSPAPAPPIPSVSITTGPATSIRQTSAWLGVLVTANVSTRIVIDYGRTTRYGGVFDAGADYGPSPSVRFAEINATGLSCGTTYQYRARDVRSGTVGVNHSFTTARCDN